MSSLSCLYVSGVCIALMSKMKQKVLLLLL